VGVSTYYLDLGVLENTAQQAPGNSLRRKCIDHVSELGPRYMKVERSFITMVC